jgi:branched-chain amino acid aminotransferase
MINVNGIIQKNQNFSFITNRSFLYGDALFDTLIYRNTNLVFIEAHYFRLLASMRQLRMEIPSFFTQDYWEEEILKTLKANNLSDARVRTTIYRDSKGLYTPNTNSIQFIIQTNVSDYQMKHDYTLGIYRDDFLNTNSLDNLKTTNRIQNVLASIYAKENNFDTCSLLNHRKQVAETIHANIFMIFGNQIKTPALTEGCINGIIRNKVIDLVNKISDLQLIECEITAFELQQADEVFITNSVIGIQSIKQYKKKTYNNEVTKLLKEEFDRLI